MAEWRKAGGSATAFARSAGVGVTTLLRWHERFGDSLDVEPKFARVVVRGTGDARVKDERAGDFVVEAIGGRRIHVRAGFDGGEFGRLLEIVEAAGC